MKQVKVAAAVIVHEGKVLAMRRNYGEFAGGWEFPGGKLEAGESPEEALKREIREELKVSICVGKYLGTVEYDYSNFHLTMLCYICRIETGKPALLVHDASKWLNKEQLHDVAWLAADEQVVSWLQKPEIQF